MIVVVPRRKLLVTPCFPAHKVTSIPGALSTQDKSSDEVTLRGPEDKMEHAKDVLLDLAAEYVSPPRTLSSGAFFHALFCAFAQ